MEGIIIALAAGGLALLFALITALRVLKNDPGNQRMRVIGDAIREGASAFLRREYMSLLPFVLIVFVVLWVVVDWRTLGTPLPRTGISYLAGAICSATAGIIGMNIAVRANVRTAAAAMHGLNPALRVAFSSGSVMGITVVGIGLLGVTILYTIFQNISVVAGFGMGASSIALFARVGGGIFTKAADVGSDLVGKVEAGIPEDDPRNPGVIADNVGDNVGDVAGMGADLFESYVGAIISTIALATVGTALTSSELAWDDPWHILPLVLAGAGILAAILGTFIVRSGERADFGQLLWALRRGIFASSILVVLFALGIVIWMDVPFTLFWAIITGLIAGLIIGLATEYYTSYEYKPTKYIAETSQTGAATVMISGIATGMISTVIPVLTIGVAILISYELADFYGVALAGVGLLSTLGITLATDAYGPVADNAGGIAEQAHLAPEVRQRTDALDALGNTTAATGKGFAIGSAALTSLALLAAYAGETCLLATAETPRCLSLIAEGRIPESINLLSHTTLVGLFVGAMLPFLFSAFTMKAVGRAAYSIVNEVRRQFREIPGLMEGRADARPDYKSCVDIATKGALREMIMPGVLAVVAPLATGFILGTAALGGLLMGAVASGFMLAVMMASAGGAWDNAKKYVELGHYGGKGSDAHKAAVEGDVVGDPFKDTSGPSLNILLKLMAIVALVFAPVFLQVTPLIDLF